MKHTNLFIEQTANGLHTPPCGTSRSKSTRFFILTLLLGLLTIGSTSAWAASSTAYFTPGATIYFHVTSSAVWTTNSNSFQVILFDKDDNTQAIKKTDNTTTIVDACDRDHSCNLYDYTGSGHHLSSDVRRSLTKINDNYYSFTIPLSGKSVGFIRLIRNDPDADGWSHQHQPQLSADDVPSDKNCFAYTAFDEGAVTFEAHNFTSSVTTGGSGGGGSGPVYSNYTLRGDFWCSSGWVSASSGPKFVDNGDGTYSLDIVFNQQPPRIAFHDNGTEKDAATIFDEANSTSGLKNTYDKEKVFFNQLSGTKKLTLTYTSATNKLKGIVSNYDNITSGWHLFVDDVDKGEMSASGVLDVADMSGSSGGTPHTVYITDGSATTWWGVNKFGGIYIDESNSNVSYGTKYQCYGDKFNASLTFPVVGTQDLKGRFKLTSTSTVRFTFDGGKITINTVAAPAPAATYTVTIHPNNGGDNIVRNNVPEGSNSSAAALNLSVISYGAGTATWYTNEACTTPFSTVTSDMDLYAKWGVSGNFYFVSCLQTANDGGGESGNWNNGYGQKLTHTFIAPSGHMPFEVIKDKDWGQKINGGNYDGMFDNSKSDVTISAAHGHMDFTLDAPKQVTVSYDGKVAVNVANYAFDNSKTWRIKTSWGNGGNAWNYNTLMTNNGTSNATAILRNVPAGQNSFVVTTRNNDDDAMATVGTETFNALYVDTSNPSSGLTWNNTSARRDGSDNFNSTTPQTDNRWRNCSFSLSQISDIRITFDGGKIRCDILPKYTVTFDSNGGSAVASQTMFEGLTATEPSAPSRQGYTFQGWKLNDNTYNFSTAVTGNITLVADWSANPLPAGSFYVFGAGGTNWVTGWSSNIIEDYRMDVANGEATKTFYNVSGSGLEFKIRNFTDGVLNSNNKQDFTNAIVTPLAEDNSRLISRVWANGETNIDFSIKSGSSANVTVHFNGHEIWLTAVEVFTVTFDSEGGSAEASQLVTVGGNATRPVNNPNKDGYTFNFWKLSGESTAFDFENTTITSNITLVADWSEVPAVHYTVTFMDGLTELTALAQDVIEGNHASAPSEQSKDGYTFVEWRENGASTAFDFEQTAIGGNVILYAIWEAKTMTGISLNEDALAMVIDNVTELTATFAPSDLIAGNQPTYEWSVLPAGVVTLSANNGTCSVTAVEEGNATITCTATAGNIERSATCTVSVQACNLVATDIFAYTLGSDPTGDAAGSAVMNGMFNEADNTEPAELDQYRILLHDNAGNTEGYFVYAPDNNAGTHLKYGDVNTNYAYWTMIEAGKTDDEIQKYAFKNAATGYYLAKADGYQSGNWGAVAAITATTYVNNTAAQWHWAKSNDQDRLMNVERSDGDNQRENGEYFLTRDGANSGGVNTGDKTVGVGGSDGHQGRATLTTKLVSNRQVANPAYLRSPDASGYYRFATGANVVVTLNRAIKLNDVIRLEVKNPSEAAVSATVTIGSQVENINLAAGTTTTEEITVTDANRPTAITIASDDVNFMLKSVVVNREMPDLGRNPNLAWGATPSAAHNVAAGDISSYIATRSGEGLITYTSSDESIATVAADGTVHPIAEGTVTITATLEQDGCYNGGTINYSLTLNDLPKPTITLTVPDAAVPQGSVQTISASQNGDGEFTVSILSGSDATLTNNGDGTYTLRLGDNASNIVIEAATTRTDNYAQHAVTETVEVTNCAPDGRVIYSYTLTGHDNASDVAAEGGTYSQTNLASVGTTDNPKTVELIKIKFQNDQNRIIVDDGGDVKYVTNSPEGNIEKWYKIPAGTNSYNNALYYLKNKGTDKYLYCDMASGYVGTQNGWNIYAPKMAATLPSTTLSTGNTREAYKWFWYPHNGTENNNLHLTVNQGYQNSHATRFVLHDKYDVAGSNLLSPYVRCGQGTDQGNSELRVVNEVVNANAENPDYFYSVENDDNTYYILNGGTVTVSRASAFKAGDVITLNIFNRGAAAGNTIKVANNTIATNVNGAAALQYTVAEGDGIQGQNNFVITPLNDYICLSSISIFRPKDEDEFINPTLTWDDDLSAQQVIDMNNSETGMTHAIASINAPVNAAVVYSVSPAAKADINSATGALTLTGEAQNKDVLTVTATLPAIGCYNQAVASYEIYVKNLATPTLSAAFGTLKQGYASTLTVSTNSDAVPALSSLNGFAVNGDPTVDNGVYTYNIIVSSTAEAVSVHVALEETADYLAYAIDAEDANVAVSNIADLYDNTPANGTLVLEADYAGNLIVDKTITINGNGHSIGNLTVENSGDLTLSGNLTVNDFTICAKAGNSEHPGESGQVHDANRLNPTGNVYFLYTVDPSGHVQFGWYDFTVPFPVNVMTGIKGIQDEVLKENFQNEVDYAIMEFLGDNLAQRQYSYKKYRGVMQPGKLYSITLDDDYNYNTVRFQKTNDGALVLANDQVTLDEHPSSIDNKYADWNGVGNGTLHHADAAGVSAEYIQVYQSGDKSFLPYSTSGYSFAVGAAFMVKEAGTMTLSQANHSLLAPRRAASVTATAIQIAREGKPFSDQLFITADETGGSAYTDGVDLPKIGDLGSARVPQIWANAYNSKLCVHEAQLLNGKAQYNLSLYAPVNGTYTLTTQHIPDEMTLYLTQNGKAIWNLSLAETYTLDLTKGTTTEYGLLLVESPRMPTGVDNIQGDQIPSTKVLRNGILYILHNGKVFNAQGASVK